MPRFTLDTKNTMRIGQEVYTSLIKKMLSVHIAHIDRKLKACVQCPARCRPVNGKLKQNPYTRPYKGSEFIPREMLPIYLQHKLRKGGDERRLRREAERTEAELRAAGGDVDQAQETQDTMRQYIEARIRALGTPSHPGAAVGENIGEPTAVEGCAACPGPHRKRDPDCVHTRSSSPKRVSPTSHPASRDRRRPSTGTISGRR